jgi:hypothetical protein
MYCSNIFSKKAEGTAIAASLRKPACWELPLYRILKKIIHIAAVPVKTIIGRRLGMFLKDFLKKGIECTS